MSLTNIETNIILDLYDYDTTPTKIKAIQLDSNTRYVSAVIRNRSGIYDVGQTAGVTLTIIRPDMVGVQITGEPVAHTETTPDQQVITTYGAYAELSLVALAVKGNLKAQFMLKSGDQVLRTEIFTISCGEALDASTDTWAGEYQGYNLDELVQNVNSAVATVEGMEQDVSELKSGISELQDGGYVADAQKIQEKIDKYLDEHPEATTTVQDGSISFPKLHSDVKKYLSDVTLMPAGNVDIDGVRVISNDNDEIVSVMPYKADGYSSVELAHTRENLISTPYKTTGTDFYKLIIVADNNENKVTISGNRTTEYSQNYTFKDSIVAPAGNYILCGASDCAFDGSTQFLRLVLKNNNNNIKVEQCHLSPIIEASIEEDTENLGAGLFIYGKFGYSGSVYPLLGRGEKLTKTLGATVYGGSYNWKTGELVSLYDSTGELLSSPVTTNIGSVDITYYDTENWFYSNTGHIGIKQPVTLEERLNNIEIDVFFNTVDEMRNSNPKNGSIVRTCGFYFLGDGGGATYRISEKQDGDVDSPTSIVFGNYVAKLVIDQNKEVNVRQFGARGDGSSNDTSAFLAAVAYANKVVVPDGTYLLSETVEITEGKQIELAPNATINLNANVTGFILRNRASLIGRGMIYTYHLGSVYSSSAVLITNNSSSDIWNATIRDVRFVGSFGNGKAIEFDSNASQILYCTIDNVNIYAFAYGIYSRGTQARGECYVNATVNESACAFYGALSNSFIRISGETGKKNDISQYVIDIPAMTYSFIINGMVDIGNPNRIPYGIRLGTRTKSNVVMGITLNHTAVVDQGVENIIVRQLNNMSKTGASIVNHRYNNILANVSKRYDVSVTLDNCTVSSITGDAYTKDLFIDSIAEIVPTKVWCFTAIDDSVTASVQIDIDDVDIRYLTYLSYEWYKATEYGQVGNAFAKIELYGKYSGENEYTLLGEKLHDKEMAYDGKIRAFNIDLSTYDFVFRNHPPISNVRIVFSFEKSATYPAKAYITALTLCGMTEDTHQSFVQSSGSTVYGDIDFYQGYSPVIHSPNGTAFKLTVANDGTLTAESVEE